MNIYITPENEAKLRKEKSMSGLINDLLKKHYGTSQVEHTTEPLPTGGTKHTLNIGSQADLKKRNKNGPR